MHVAAGQSPFRIGVISDTHGLMRSGIREILAGCAHIFHAGDIGTPAVLEQLQSIAPLSAVRGNVDYGVWTEKLPWTIACSCGDHHLYMRHVIEDMDINPQGQFDIVIHGHSHEPRNEVIDGVRYFNPGSAGPQRFHLPITLGIIELKDGEINAQHIEIAG